MVDISVVIPTFNRGPMLDRCLEALTQQGLPTDRFEVIVADDDSSDDTPERGADWERSGRLRLRYLRCPKGFAGGARNRGAALAVAPRVLFLGDDILAEPDLLERHVAGHAAFGEDAVLVGEVRYTDEPPPTTFMRWLEADGVHHDFPRLRAMGQATVPGRYFYACNASVPTRALASTGGFDERIQRAWEDTEFGVRLERAGFPMYFLPGVSGTHVHPIDLPRYVRFLRAGRPDVARVVRALRELGETIPPAAEHPVLDRVVTDAVVDRAASVTAKVERFLPMAVRRRAYRRVLRHERRWALLAAEQADAAR